MINYKSHPYVSKLKTNGDLKDLKKLLKIPTKELAEVLDVPIAKVYDITRQRTLHQTLKLTPTQLDALNNYLYNKNITDIK